MITTKKYGVKGRQIGRTGLFYIAGDKVALSASLSKRTFARILDLIIAGIVGTTIFAVFYFTGIKTADSSNVLTGATGPE
jgi:hypothetical protein